METNLTVFRTTYTGPLMMSAIIMFISAMYSCRSGYGKSSSEELMDIMKKYIKKERTERQKVK